MRPKRHERCPNCASLGKDTAGDNLGVWDTHKYCIVCGYTEFEKYSKLKVVPQFEKKVKQYLVALPKDCSQILSKNAENWLDFYDLSDAEKGNFLWSEEYERLIYPIYDNNGFLVASSGRKFPTDNKKHAKYRTEGNIQKIYHFIGPLSTSVVVVEDVVSALKVGRQYLSMPLFGGYIGPERIRKLSERFSELWIWLDKDKAQESLKTRLNALPYFDIVRCIVTEKDPKEYSDMEIKEILNV